MALHGRRPSIKDVAALAGVSTKTVSNVLHGHHYLRESTRKKVEDAIAELDYRPDLSARNLRRGRTGLIALALPALDVPYYAELASQVVQAAREHDYTVLVDETREDPERERDLLTGIGPRLADAVIYNPAGLGRADLAEIRLRLDTPVVLIGEDVANLPLDHVMIDNVAAAAEATAHLFDQGRRRVAALGLLPASKDDLRLRGYRKALRARRVRVDRDLLVTVDDPRRSEDGAAAMRRLLALENPPDAVFCWTDLLAYGALKAIHDAGLTVPDDIAVVGFDDLVASRSSIPALTSISPDKAAIARQAVDRVLLRLAEPDIEPRTVITPYSLSIRQSSTS